MKAMRVELEYRTLLENIGLTYGRLKAKGEADTTARRMMEVTFETDLVSPVDPMEAEERPRSMHLIVPETTIAELSDYLNKQVRIRVVIEPI
jgi:hypothetical protein